MPTVLLVTFPLLPDGEPAGELLVTAFAARGVEAQWVCWDDAGVDWAGADVVAVRSTWDYHRRLPEFLAWAAAVDEQTTLLNGADVFTWNADKAYLAELADAVPVVPTATLDDADLRPGLQAAIDAYGAVVVKARTGAGGVGVVVAESTDDERLAGLSAGPWVVQPLVESVRTTGESSVFVLDGRAVSQVDKLHAGEEIRVHGAYGGSSRPVALDPVLAVAAERALAVAARRLGRPLTYGRVDLMSYGGESVVSELELIEPGLYLDIVPANADAFADLVTSLLA
ncbi:ATP-grasp domain-containing protein [Nocardioides pacificus]